MGNLTAVVTQDIVPHTAEELTSQHPDSPQHESESPHHEMDRDEV